MYSGLIQQAGHKCQPNQSLIVFFYIMIEVGKDFSPSTPFQCLAIKQVLALENLRWTVLHSVNSGEKCVELRDLSAAVYSTWKASTPNRI
jgi:hypothetical protein